MTKTRETDTKETSDGVASPERRKVLIGAAVAAALAGTGSAFAQHEHHQHQAGAPHAALVAAASHCVSTAEACLAHCIGSFKTGDTSLAECAAKVLDLSATCTALAKLGTYNSTHLKAIAVAAAGVCEDCEAVCRKHEHHPECKACADSCKPCIEEIAKLSA